MLFSENTKTVKDTIFAFLAAGTLTPAAVVFLDNMLSLSGRLMNSLGWLIIVFPFCVLGLIIWMIRYRSDEGRRMFGIMSIIVGVISIFASAPTVIR